MNKLKLPEKEKTKEWYKDWINYAISNSSFLDVDKMLSCYQAVNMDLSYFKDKISKFCSPEGELLTDSETEELIAYSDLKSKVNVLKGEIIKRNDRMVVQLLSSTANEIKNKELQDLIQKSIDEKLGIELLAFQEQMKGMSAEESQQLIQQMRSELEVEDITKDFMSGTEIFANKALKYCYYVNDIKSLQVDTLEDAVISDRFYIYNCWKNGKPHLEIRNPLYVKLPLNEHQPFVHKRDWLLYYQQMSVPDILANYDISEDEVRKITGGNNIADKRHNVYGNAEPMYSTIQSDFYKGLHANHNLVNVIHFEFKAFKRVMFLTYQDELNQTVTEILSEDFEIPKDAKKEKFVNRFEVETSRYVWFDALLNKEFQIEEIWIPRKYEVVKIGDDLYPVMREVPYQETNIEDPFSTFSLSTKGVILNNRNAESISMVEQALPIYLQLLYVKRIQIQELSKYRGYVQSIDVDQIPDELGLDNNGEKVRDKIVTYLTWLKKTNYDFYSGSQNSLGGLPPSTRSPGSNGYMLGTAIELMNLQQLAELLKRELSMAMGISPQREANYTQGTNVSDNQQAVIQSYTITEPLFFKHALVWKDALLDWLKAFKKYCLIQTDVLNLKSLSFEYWLPDGTKETLKVFPDNLDFFDIGLFLVSNSASEKYSDLMLQYSHAFAQNQGQGINAVSQIIKDIVTGSSPEEIHKRIQIEENKSFQRQKELQNLNNEQLQTIEQLKQEGLKEERQHEEFMLRLKSELDRETELLVEGIKATSFGKQKDLNNNQVPDSIDQAKILIEEEKLKIKREELKLKEKVFSKKEK